MAVAGQSLLAWVGLPTLFGLVALGLGLLVERLLGLRAPAPVLFAGGAAFAVLIPYTLYKVMGGALGAGIVLLVVPALAGLVLGRAGLRERLRPGPAGYAALGAYVLVLAPVVLSGRWSWTGYNFVNDTSVQLLLASYLPHHGFVEPGYTTSSAGAVLTAYISTAYPAGSHTLLGTLAPILPTRLASLYQPYLAIWVALLAASLTQLARFARTPPRWAFAAGLGAAGANLFYQYALQGNVKEMAFASLFGATTVCGAWALTERRPERAIVFTGAAAAAAFSSYSTAGLPYLAALAGMLLVAFVLRRSRRDAREPAPLRRYVIAAGVGAVVAVVLAAPAIKSASTFTRVAKSNFGSQNRAADIGQLVRPLPRIQSAGVWLTGDYRFPVVGRLRTPNGVLAVFVVLLALLAVAMALWRRDAFVPLALVPPAATILLLLPRVSPYAGGKVLAIASSFVVFGAVLGARELSRRWVWPGVLAALVALGAVAASDALAYRQTKLAPIGRLEALHEATVATRAPRVIMANEAEEFAKNYMGPERMNVLAEAITPYRPDLLVKGYQAQTPFDMDDIRQPLPAYYGGVVTRRGPDESRPGADFRLAVANRWYDGWRRDRSVRVVRHLPLQSEQLAIARPRCGDVRALVQGAKPGDRLVAARRPEIRWVDPRVAPRSGGWVSIMDKPGRVVPNGPGSFAARRTFAGGEYEAWVAGSFGRAVHVTLDGRRVGTAGGIDTLNQWTPAGYVRVSPGSHRLGVVRDGGDLSPGDGFKGEIGPVALVARTPATLQRLAPSRWRSLCGRAYDWIELVRPRATVD